MTKLTRAAQEGRIPTVRHAACGTVAAARRSNGPRGSHNAMLDATKTAISIDMSTRNALMENPIKTTTMFEYMSTWAASGTMSAAGSDSNP